MSRAELSAEDPAPSFCAARAQLALQGPGSYLLVVLLEVNYLHLEGLKLHFQVRLAQGQVVQQGSQAVDVPLHILPQAILCLEPVPGAEQRGQPQPGGL